MSRDKKAAPAAKGARAAPSPQLELPETRGDTRRVEKIERLSPAARDGRIVADRVRWFDAAARDLPWRRRRDPYAVWLSEIMLQQTRVETVIPYFERFLERFPDVTALARAEPDEVLSLWSGLGYYRRARQLHAAAKAVADRHGGAFPGEAAALRDLPGVGAYTAGAIASIAFGKREPLVDGNVARVFARLEGLAEPVGSTAMTKALWERASALVPADRPGRFNEALMELGATVCTPKDPACKRCPLESICVARAEGRVAELPVAASKRPVPSVSMVALVLTRGAEVLLARRAEGGLFGGLWEPPMVEAASIGEAKKALGWLGLGRSVKLAEVGTVKHVLTHRELTVHVARGSLDADAEAPGEPKAPYEKAGFYGTKEAAIGISTLARKVLATARG
ncbi:MAG: A/G-specific adenine glycosylase [Byssovorax sp.]